MGSEKPSEKNSSTHQKKETILLENPANPLSISVMNERPTNCAHALERTLLDPDARAETESSGGCSRLRPKQALGVLPIVCSWLRAPGVAAGWYVVAIACGQELLNGWMWATFGPISRTAVHLIYSVIKLMRFYFEILIRNSYLINLQSNYYIIFADK